MEADLSECFNGGWRVRRDRRRLRIAYRPLDSDWLFNVCDLECQFDPCLVGPIPAIDVGSVLLQRDIAGALSRQARDIAREAEFECINDSALASSVASADREILSGKLHGELANTAKFVDFHTEDLDHVPEPSVSSGRIADRITASVNVSSSSNTGLSRAAISCSAGSFFSSLRNCPKMALGTSGIARWTRFAMGRA